MNPKTTQTTHHPSKWKPISTAHIITIRSPKKEAQKATAL